MNASQVHWRVLTKLQALQKKAVTFLKLKNSSLYALFLCSMCFKKVWLYRNDLARCILTGGWSLINKSGQLSRGKKTEGINQYKNILITRDSRSLTALENCLRMMFVLISDWDYFIARSLSCLLKILENKEK